MGQSVEQEQLEKKMAYRSGSSASGGSRYPSAYGHTPSYRSYNSLGSSSTSYDLPSSSYKSDLARELARDHKTTSFADDKFFSDVDRTFDTPLMTSSTAGGSGSSSSKKVSSYSSSYSSSSGTGSRPVVEYSTDSSYKSSSTGASGIPHSSYAHTSSSYSSDNPYKNRVSSYSYNI